MSRPGGGGDRRRVSVIYNPSAGGGRAWRALPEVQAALQELDVEHRVTATTDLEHASELAREAAGNGEVAAALGGDGLVGRVAGALRGTDAVLGVLPGGRGNDLARVLGIPSEPAQACRVLADGVERRLDLGEVNGRTFIGIASCGFDSDANRIANGAPARLGKLVYAYGALRALVGWRPAAFELELDGATHRYRGWSVAAANSKAYGGGMYLAPGAALDDGLLDVVCLSDSSRLRFLANLPRVFKGTHVADAAVEVRRAREVTVRADRPFVVYADGDPISELPVTIRAVPGAVRVLMPAGADPAGTGPGARP
ncbi:MAG: diacylglycerol/lipid kinase family protein [Solirubrobacteraceae bacterium]